MPVKKRRTPRKAKKSTKPCTYDIGYVRQDLYACRKCTEAAGVHFGFCAGCRETCHSDHMSEVFELYTKRAFRCDCGNNRAKNSCHLQPDKDDVNINNENAYSHNFEGRYCRCDREYDPSDIMTQCAMCEDWFHEDCLKLEPRFRKELTPPFDIGYELVCKDCVTKLPLLESYSTFLHAFTTRKEVRKWQAENAESKCSRPAQNVSSRNNEPGSTDLLWRPGFRVHLCRCPDCLSVYHDSNVSYIVDRTDFIDSFDDDSSDGGSNIANEDVILSDDEDIIEVEPVRSKIDNSVLNRARAGRSASGHKYSLPQSDSGSDVLDSFSARLQPSTVEDIRYRILTFLHNKLVSGEHENQPMFEHDVLSYVSDLKADLVATFCKQIDGAIPE